MNTSTNDFLFVSKREGDSVLRKAHAKKRLMKIATSKSRYLSQETG